MPIRRDGPTALVPLIAASIATAQDAGGDRLAGEAAAQAARADKLFKEGRFEAALTLYRAERDSRRKLGDARYEAYALRGIGCCLIRLKDDEAAIDAFKEARAIDAGRDDKGFEGYDGLLLAQSESRLGRHADAVKTLAAALPKLGQAIDRDHECDARVCLVSARLELGEAAEAVDDADRALALAEGLNDPARLADARLARGLVDRDLGRLEPARKSIEQARDAYRAQGREDALAAATRRLADVSCRLGRFDLGASQFAEASALHARLGDVEGEAEDRLDLASARLALGDPAAAEAEAARARDGFRLADDEPAAIEAMVVLAQAQSRSKGDDADARAAATIRDALDRSARAHRDAPADRVRLLLLSADLEHRLGRRADAAARLDAASAVAAKSGDEALSALVAEAAARLVPRR